MPRGLDDMALYVAAFKELIDEAIEGHEGEWAKARELVKEVLERAREVLPEGGQETRRS